MSATVFRSSSPFAKLRETPSWKAYVKDNQLEDRYAKGEELRKTVVDIEKQLKEQYQAAGVKTVR